MLVVVTFQAIQAHSERLALARKKKAAIKPVDATKVTVKPTRRRSLPRKTKVVVKKPVKKEEKNEEEIPDFATE